jgi:hypothetical protein
MPSFSGRFQYLKETGAESPLVRQVDRSEAFADYRAQARIEGLLAVAILAILGLVMLQFRRIERASRLREVAESEARLAGVIRSAGWNPHNPDNKC